MINLARKTLLMIADPDNWEKRDESYVWKGDISPMDLAKDALNELSNWNQLRENLAAYAHRAWSGWMDYLFRKGHFTPSGEFTINADSVKRWQRQMKTDYACLPDSEKLSDRLEADYIIGVFDEEDNREPTSEVPVVSSLVVPDDEIWIVSAGFVSKIKYSGVPGQAPKVITRTQPEEKTE